MTEKKQIERVVGYVRVSTQDQVTNGWNLDEDRRLIEERCQEEGWELVATYDDAARQGDDPGRPGLAALLTSLTDIDAVIMRQQDRISRDPVIWGTAAAAFQKADVRVLTFTGEIDLDTPQGRFVADMMAAVGKLEKAQTGQRVRQALSARARAGKPLGALPGLGYEVERTVVNDHETSRRIVSPTTGPLVVEMFERIADDQTPGAVGRWLNDQGIRTIRGALFNQRTVRKIIFNDAFIGMNGYDRIVSDELAQTAREKIVRLDPAEVQRRKGGRRPNEPYLLRGVAFCAECGAALYRSYVYLGGERAYACRNKLETTGACNAPVIPAELLEAHVLNHLGTFVGSLESWMTDQLAARKEEHANRARKLDRERDVLKALHDLRERHLTEYRKQVDDGKSTASLALEEVERIDQEIAAQKTVIEQVEAVVSEHAAPPDVDAALDYYASLRDAIRGRVSGASSIEELNVVLSNLLAGMWCEVEKTRRRVLVNFAFKTPKQATLPDGQTAMDDRMWLPPVRLDAHVMYDPILSLSGAETMQLTTVSACCL